MKIVNKYIFEKTFEILNMEKILFILRGSFVFKKIFPIINHEGGK